MIISYVKKTVRWLLIFILAIILFVGTYLLAARIISRIEVPKQLVNSEKNIEIYIKSNGVHTDIIVPIKTKFSDWSALIPYQNTKDKDSLHKFLAFGWGDKGFYLNTPTWDDLTFETAFNAAFGLSTTAIHTTFYKELQLSKTCRKIQISEEQYLSLSKFIRNSLQVDNNKKAIFIKTNAVYGTNDAFYEANGNYNLFQTCNSWANKALIASGQKAALWTPFQDGIFCHYEK